MTPLFESLYDFNPLIYGALGGGIAGLVGALGLKRGHKLVPMFTEDEASSNPLKALEFVIPIILIIAIAVYSFFTHRISIFLGMIGISAAIWALYYAYSQKKGEESEDNNK